MHCAPTRGAVVATPMQDEIGIDDTIAGAEFDLQRPRQRTPGILGEVLVLLRRIGSPMTARHDPQHIVIVQCQIPLQVARTVGEQILL